MIIFALYIAGMIALFAFGIYDSARGKKIFPEWARDPVCPSCRFKTWTVYEQRDEDESNEPWKCPVCGFQELQENVYLRRLFNLSQRSSNPDIEDRNIEGAIDENGITPVGRLIRENGTDE